MDFELNFEELRSTITESGAAWEAGRTDFTAMSDEERQLHLGYTPGPDDPSLEESEQLARANLEAFRAAADADEAFGYPASYDLRNVGGANYITSVKNQGNCGSCVSFGTVAAVEGRMRRQRNSPNLAVDYSEAHLYYCHARSEGRNCGNGWWPDRALNAVRDKGVVDDACYPYTAGDQACTGLCADNQSRLTKITGWHRVSDAAAMKEWISTQGPLVACYTVYQDFYAYRGGIYTYVSGNAVGGHCVCCVGYNDAERYWICKNSWGTGFGESGYFRIAYGQCGIDSFMDAADGIAETGWERDKRVTGLWTINEDRNAWVHVAGLGWRKVSAENDNIFVDMLAQLVAAKAGARRVDLYQENAMIKQTYVF